MLEVRSIEAAYGAAQVLFGVSFSVGDGEVVTLLGRNGVGKTTTISAIMGLMPTAAGEIRFAKSASDNFDLARLSRTAPAPAVSDFFTSDGSGNELNSATKLTGGNLPKWSAKSRRRNS